MAVGAAQPILGVSLAAASHGRVGVASRVPSVCASGTEPVELEFNFHSSSERDVDRFKESLGAFFFASPVAMFEAVFPLEHARYLSSRWPLLVTFVVRFGPPGYAPRPSWGFLYGVASFAWPLVVGDEVGLRELGRFGFALGKHLVSDSEESPYRIAGSRFLREHVAFIFTV